MKSLTMSQIRRAFFMIVRHVRKENRQTTLSARSLAALVRQKLQEQGIVLRKKT